MSKLVVLSLGKGDFYKGFPNVTVQLGKPDDPRSMEFRGSLPAAPKIPQLYRDWQLLYSALNRRLGWCPRLEIEDADVTNVSEVEFNDLRQLLSNKINDWLNSEQFRRIDQKLRTQLDPTEEIRFMIATNDNLLRRIPWHLWNFFEDYPYAEVALSPPEFQRSYKTVCRTTNTQVKILAILGNSEGIDIDKDKTFLKQLSNKTKIEFLVEPQRQELNQKLLEGWDILFFAGHSSTKETGLIQINQTEEISLEKLRNALKKAIERGLKLAIFNSCDGLGLAKALEDLHIPQVIVMREAVPDVVAQEFLRRFVAEFSQGQSLYAAVREAREGLEGLEGEYPCATWFPVICQNPAEEPITPPLCQPPISQIAQGIQTVLLVLLVSLMVAASVMGVRYLGMLQPWELHAFDHLMQLRPATEPPEQRLLIVGIDEADIQYQIQHGMNMRWSLSDQALAQLLQKLEKYQPRTIGLDIYRNGSVEPDYADLATHMQQDDRLFAVCKVSVDDELDSIPPPSEVPEKRWSFSDFVADDEDIARRQLLHLTPPLKSLCTAQYAFSLQLALHYLDAQGIKSDVTKEGHLRIGDVVFKQLKEHTSGYQGVDASGYQMLLNYRSLRSPEKIAEQVPLRKILKDQIKPELMKSVKDRIVLIGLTAPTTTNDYWKTPYSAIQPPNQKQIPGVFMQAQMVSQILSAVLDHRPLLWWWSWRVEALWVWGWSLVGGIMAWCYLKPLHLGLAVALALLTLFAICFVIFTQAGWVPLVPSALALVATQAAVVFITRRTNLSRRHHLSS